MISWSHVHCKADISLHAHLNPQYASNLSASVTTVNDQIGTSSICARIRAQINIRALQLLRITIASHRNHAHPQILDLLVNEVAQPSVNVARGDGVDTSEVAPLVGQRASHVDAAGLGDVV